MQWLLIRLRKERKLTQKDMAALLGLNVSTYINKETGDSQFKADEIFFLMEYFGKEIDEIFLPRKCINNAVEG